MLAMHFYFRTLNQIDCDDLHESEWLLDRSGMFSKPSKSNFLQISPLPFEMSTGNGLFDLWDPWRSQLERRWHWHKEKNGESERKAEKEFEEASVTVNTIWQRWRWGGGGGGGGGGGDSFCIFREVSLWERHRWERRTGGREAWLLEGDTALWQWDKLPPFHFGLLFWEVVKAYACLSVFPLGLSSRCSSLEGLYNGTNIYKI